MKLYVFIKANEDKQLFCKNISAFLNTMLNLHILCHIHIFFFNLKIHILQYNI
jgi:hypothetical protein